MSLSPFSIPVVLAFDIADPTGIEGVQAHVQTLSACRVLPMSVVTGVSVGAAEGVRRIVPLDSELLIEQAQAVLEDMSVAAMLIGNCASVDNLAVIAEIIADYDLPTIFMPAPANDESDWDEREDMLAASAELLVPLASLLIVPPLLARSYMALADEESANELSDLDAARGLLEYGADYVLITSMRDAALQPTDILISSEGIVRSDLRHAELAHLLGIEQSLAAACAAGIAKGFSVDKAVEFARHYLTDTVAHSVNAGMGKQLIWRGVSFGSLEQ